MDRCPICGYFYEEEDKITRTEVFPVCQNKCRVIIPNVTHYNCKVCEESFFQDDKYVDYIVEPIILLLRD